jgi:hypothetical protein
VTPNRPDARGLNSGRFLARDRTTRINAFRALPGFRLLRRRGRLAATAGWRPRTFGCRVWRCKRPLYEDRRYPLCDSVEWGAAERVPQRPAHEKGTARKRPPVLTSDARARNDDYVPSRMTQSLVADGRRITSGQAAHALALCWAYHRHVARMPHFGRSAKPEVIDNVAIARSAKPQRPPPPPSTHWRKRYGRS